MWRKLFVIAWALNLIGAIALCFADTTKPAQSIGSDHQLYSESSPQENATGDLGTVIQLRIADPCEIGASAEFMSVGPKGPAKSDTVETEAITFIESSYRRLRVTLSRCERSEWLTINVIVTGRADSRRLSGSYKFSTNDVTSMTREKVAQGFEPYQFPSSDPIVWLSPKKFIWQVWNEAVVLEHLSEEKFRVRRVSRY